MNLSIQTYNRFLLILPLVFGFITGCKKEDESLISGNVILVDCNAGGNTLNGRTWNTAFQSIQEAIDSAVSGKDFNVTSDQEIWVAKGTYYENLFINSGILLYGGFAGNESNRDQRDWNKNLTIIDGSRLGTVVNVTTILVSETRIDGFVIQNGYPEGEGDGGGIIVSYDNLGFFTIENNTIQYNTSYGFGGIYLGGESSVKNNLIQFNESLSIYGSKEGSGISCYNCSPEICNNTFKNNNSTNGSAFNGWEFRGEFMNNVISEGKGSIVYVGYSNGLFANNLIVNNTEADRIFVIYFSGTKVINNTISANPNACAFELISNSYPQIVNNIITENDFGIKNYDDDSYSVITRNNCLYNNTKGNYEDIFQGEGDILGDPMLTNDFRLSSASPCINNGDNSVVRDNWVDIDGDSRIIGDKVDIGADEYN